MRKRDWAGVKELTLEKGSGDDFAHYPDWLRHALTLGRARQSPPNESGRTADRAFAAGDDRRGGDRLAPLRPDLAAGDEAITTSLTQFDLLSILCAIAGTGALDTRSLHQVRKVRLVALGAGAR